MYLDAISTGQPEGALAVVPLAEKRTTQTMPILIVDDGPAIFFLDKSTEFGRLAKLPRVLRRR